MTIHIQDGNIKIRCHKKNNQLRRGIPMARQIIWKKIRGKYGPYAYLYESRRDPVTGMPKKFFIRYLGKIPMGTKIAHVKEKKTPGLWKTRNKPKGRQGRKIRGRRPKACTMPMNRKCRHPRCVRWACQYYSPVKKRRKRRK